MCLDIILTGLMTFYEAYIGPQSPNKIMLLRMIKLFSTEPRSMI